MAPTKTAARKQPATAPTTGSGIVITGYDPDSGTEDTPLPNGVYYEDTKIPDDRVELFRLEGRVYTAPKKLKPNLIFKALRRMRTEGTDAAMFEIISEVMDPQVVDVLADHEDLTDEELDQIMAVIQKHTMSVMEKSAGKSQNGRKK